MNISDVLKKVHGEMLVQPITARCLDVSERKIGTSSNGDWSLQSLYLDDGSGKIRMTAWGRADLSNFKDQEIIVSASKNDRGWSGCSVEERIVEGRKYKQIKLSVNGKLILSMAAAAQPSSSRPGPSVNGKPTVWEYLKAFHITYTAIREEEPDPAAFLARARISNQTMLNFGQGKFYLPEDNQEQEKYRGTDKPPGTEAEPSDDDIPF